MKNKYKALIAGGVAFGIVYLMRRGTTMTRAQGLIADPVYFAHDSFNVDSEGQARLQEFVSLFARMEPRALIVVGHTDSDGTVAYNHALSLSRAQAVMMYLGTLGVPLGRMEVRGAGEIDPIASNLTEEGKARNRRVEIQFG